MFLVRDVFQAKYGRGDELVDLFREMKVMWAGEEHAVTVHNFRILVDASGAFFTVVTEMEIENWAAWERFLEEEAALPGFGDWFARMTPLVDSGRREFYKVVD